MSTSDHIRLGFIGAGQIAESACRSVKTHPRASVVAIADPNAERVNMMLKEYGIARGYTSAEDLLTEEDIDAVYIAVPNKFHAPLSIKALQEGKHVMLEKPFAISLAEAREVAQAAKSAGRHLLLGMNLRYTANSQKFYSLVKSGVFGEIYHGKAIWTRRSGIPRLGTWFGNKDLAGGGCLYDIGVHVLDLCLFVMGNFEPVSVFGATYSKFGPRGLGEGGWGRSPRSDLVFDVEDFASGLIRFTNGATVALDVSWARFAEDNDRVEVELYGTEGGGHVFADKVFRRDPVLNAYYTIGNPSGEVALPHKDRFHNFINVILGYEKPLVTLEQALIVQAILDALAESARSGRSVDVRLEAITASL